MKRARMLSLVCSLAVALAAHAADELPPAVWNLIEAQRTQPGSVVDRTYAILKAIDPGHDGSGYALTNGNALNEGWLLQTPNFWGGTPSALPVGHSDSLLNAFFDEITSAESNVEVSTLDLPTGRFLSMLQNALLVLAESKKAIRVYFVFGPSRVGGDNIDKKAVLESLIVKARKVKGSNLIVAVSTARFEPKLSWNHSKIVATDKGMIVGGHNMFANDYLYEAPTHDLSMRLKGPAAGAAYAYLARVWSFTACDRKPATYVAATNTFASECYGAYPPKPAAVGTVKVLGVGNYSVGLEGSREKSFDLIARTAALELATKSILLSQQDLLYKIKGVVIRSQSTLRAIADAAGRKVPVSIVLSSNLATAGPDKTDYSNGLSLRSTADEIFDEAKRRYNKSNAETAAILCSMITLTELRFTDKEYSNWKSKNDLFGNPGNHAKMWMIDDQAFYIGSNNAYPAGHLEYGVIVDDTTASTTLINDYWNKLWQYSSPGAVSGPGVRNCVFNKRK